MKTIIAGSRSFTNQKIMNKFLDGLLSKGLISISEIISGCANGADSCGENYAINHNIPIKKFPAHWDDLDEWPQNIAYNRYGKEYNKLAGHNRNRRMADYSEQLIAFNVNKSPGTRNMITQALNFRLKVIVFNFDVNLKFLSAEGI